MLKINHKGETIVEVLIALVILSAVIGGCYAVSNRAIVQAQQANERTAALKIAESQIEKLKYISAYATNEYDELLTVSNTDRKCIDINNTNVIDKTITPPTCTQGIYDYYFNGYAPGTHQFNFVIEWPPYHSGSNESISIQYRVSK